MDIGERSNPFESASYLGVRFGLLCYGFAILVPKVFEFSPVTLDFSAWYAGRSLLALLLFAGIAVYGFHTALAGRPLFGRALLED